MSKKTIGILLSTVILLVGFQQLLLAQPLSEVKERPYYMWLSTMDGAPKVRGFLLNYNDSLIVVSDPLNIAVNDHPVTNINRLQFRRKGSGSRGLLIGALSGALFGYAAGYSSGDDTPCSSGTWFCFRYTAEEKGAVGSIFGFFTGAGLGAILGGAKKGYYVGGNPRSYLSFQPGLAKYTLKF